MISIIVPVYNAEKRIAKCIESILLQTYENFELIIIDDGSSDRSLYICQEYEKKDSRIRVYTQKNQGVSNSRNRGIKLARGEFIQFVDSDDYISKNMVYALATKMNESDADLIVCGISKIYRDVQESLTPQMEGKVIIRDLEQKYPNVFEGYILHSPVNKLYKKNKINSFFHSDMSLGEDYTFNLDYLANCESIYFINKNYYFYVESESSLIKKYRPDSIEIAKELYIKGLEFCKSVCLKETAKINLSTFFMDAFYYGISDMYAFSSYDKLKKKNILKNWINDAYVIQASQYAIMKGKKQKLANLLVKKHCIFLLHYILLIQGKVRNH